MTSVTETLLSTLKYAGLVLGTASSLWSATTVEAREKDGRKLLTLAGKISIALIIVGFGIALVSSIVEDRINSEKEHAKSLEELERTNRLILAGQPLTSLDVEWTFEGVDQSLLDFLTAHVKEEFDDWDACFFNVPMSEIDAKRMNNHYVLYPFLNFLAGIPARSGPQQGNETISRTDENVLALISLDTSHNALLAVGTLEARFSRPRSKSRTRTNGLPFPGGVRVYTNNPCGDDAQSQAGFKEPYLEVKSKEREISIVWALDPYTFGNSVDRSAPVPISAGLPPHIAVMILSAFSRLPFLSNNLARTSVCPLWQESDNDSKLAEKLLPFSKSTLRLTPNGRAEQIVVYQLSGIRDHCVLDAYQEQCQCGGRLLEFKVQNQ